MYSTCTVHVLYMYSTCIVLVVTDKYSCVTCVYDRLVKRGRGPRPLFNGMDTPPVPISSDNKHSQK